MIKVLKYNRSPPSPTGSGGTHKCAPKVELKIGEQTKHTRQSVYFEEIFRLRWRDQCAFQGAKLLRLNYYPKNIAIIRGLT
jgi:hypothetical protein